MARQSLQKIIIEYLNTYSYHIDPSLLSSPTRLDRSSPFLHPNLSYAPDSIRIRNGLGMAYSDSKQYDKALESFDDVIAREPHLPNSYHNKGNIYSALGKFTEAEVEYKKALSVDPSFTFSVFALDDLYKKPTNQKNSTI